MSVKKYFSLTAAGLVSILATSAMAGGPDTMAPPPVDDSGFYLEIGLGYGLSNWKDRFSSVFRPTGWSTGSVSKNGSGGFAWGGDVGYQFNQNFSVELGAYDLATVNGNNGLRVPPVITPGAVRVHSWMMYFVGKLSLPVIEDLDWFAKAGMGWRFLNWTGAGVRSPSTFAAPSVAALVTNQHYFAPVFGTGLQYWFTPNWSLGVQYMYMPGHNYASQVSQNAPSVHLITANVGYKFLS